MKVIFLILAFVIFNQAIAKQKFYKWTDANGTVHYSAEEPDNQKTNTINVNTESRNKTPTVNTINENQPESNQTKEQTIDQRFAERRKKKEQIKSLTKERQKEAKGNYAKYKQSVRYRRQDSETGEYTYLEDDQRAALLKEYKKTIKRTCK